MFIIIFFSLIYLVSLCLVLSIIYLWVNRTRYYYVWKNQGIPYLPGRFPCGSYGPFNTMDLVEIETENYQKLGKIYGRFDGETPVLTVGDMDMINKILLLDFHIFPNRRDIRVGDPVFDQTLFSLEGEDWRRVRHIVSGAFRNSLKQMNCLLLNCTEDLMESLDEQIAQNPVVHCQKPFGIFVLQTIGRCAFGVKIENNNPFIEMANQLFSDSWKAIILVCFPSLAKIFKLRILNEATIKFYRDVMMRVVQERNRQSEMVSNDFLQAAINHTDMNNNRFDPERTSTLTEEELLATLISFFLAGYEVTTSLLSHAAYHLAKNQDYQQKMYDEVKSVLTPDILQIEDEVVKNEALYDCLNKLHFTQSFMYECLRICPPLTRIERRVAEDYDFPEASLKKDFLVSIPVYAMHHDPDLYPDPETFDPERFMEGPKAFKNKFFPFGDGQRRCVGMNFAITQVKLSLALLVINFKILPTEITPDTLEIIEMRNVLKVDDVHVAMVKREDPLTLRIKRQQE